MKSQTTKNFNETGVANKDQLQNSSKKMLISNSKVLFYVFCKPSLSDIMLCTPTQLHKHRKKCRGKHLCVIL